MYIKFVLYKPNLTSQNFQLFEVHSV